MGVILKNNANSTITTAISASDVGLAVAAGTGSIFPVLGAGDYFYATLVSSGGTYEIVKVTARIGDTMTIVRAQEDTTAQSFAAGSSFEARVTAASIRDTATDIVLTRLGSTTAGNGASLVGVQDTGNYYAATTVEGVLQELGASGGTVGINAIVNNFTGTGSAANFTLSKAPVSQNTIDVFIDGVYQNKNSFSFVGTTLTFTQAPPLGAAIEVCVNTNALAGTVLATNVTYNQGGTGAVNRTVQSRLRDYVSVKDFGAVGDGVADDWEACQKACDYIQALGGGTVLFPAGETFRIAGNTIIIWGSNVNLIGYGATLYKDNAGGSAGYYGDALTVFGKVNGYLYYSPQVAGGTYTAPATYTGPTVPSINVSIEGFTVTFGTHTTDSINGISGLNFEHVTVKNCVVQNSPQTSFAWVASENTDCLHLTMDNCFSDGSGMQAFRFNSYNTSPGDAGEIIAKVINCRSENTQLTVVSPWPEQYGLPSSAFVRASGNDIQFQVSFDNCQFDATTHLLDGYRTTSFRNCRLGFVFAFNANPACALMFDNCRFRDFDAATGFGGVDSQLFGRNTSGVKAVMTVKACTFETPAAGDYSIYSRGFDLDVSDCTGNMAVYGIIWSADAPSISLNNCVLKDPGTSAISLAGDNVTVSKCTVNSPINIIQLGEKSIVAQGNRFVVDATFSTSCIVVTDGNVAAINNIVEYTNNSYATVLIAPIANTILKNNQYLYAGGTELSYDESYATATPSVGYWQRTSRIINSQPNIGQPKAWVCSLAGAPGTWVSEGNL